jgi:hypothetical protein
MGTHQGALIRRAPRAHSAKAPGGRTAAGSGFAPGLEESPGSTGTTVPVNGRRGRPQGKCHRKQTARPRKAPGKGERVRQERTAPPATGAARQTPPGARPNRGGRRSRVGTSVPAPVEAGAVLPRRPGWPREARREARPRGMAVPSPLSTGVDRTRLTGRLAPFSPTACPQACPPDRLRSGQTTKLWSPSAPDFSRRCSCDLDSFPNSPAQIPDFITSYGFRCGAFSLAGERNPVVYPSYPARTQGRARGGALGPNG